jgi:hypothetical protein
LTTAQKLERSWICIASDHRRAAAIRAGLRAELGDSVDETYQVALPNTERAVLDAAKADWQEFRWWCLAAIGGFVPPGRGRSAGGVDGRVWIAGTQAPIPISVRADRLRAQDVREAHRLIQSEKCPLIVMVSSDGSLPVHAIANHPITKRHVFVLSVKDLLEHTRPALLDQITARIRELRQSGHGSSVRRARRRA